VNILGCVPYAGPLHGFVGPRRVGEEPRMQLLGLDLLLDGPDHESVRRFFRALAQALDARLEALRKFQAGGGQGHGGARVKAG